MCCTIDLFAHEGESFAKRLRQSPGEIVAQTEEWATAEDFEESDFEIGMEHVRQFCAGKTPAEIEDEFFDALRWIGAATMESIEIIELTELTPLGILSCGIIPGVLKHSAPYWLPPGRTETPLAGYLPWQEMAAFQFEEVDAETRAVLDQVADGIEGVLPDLQRAIQESLGSDALDIGLAGVGAKSDAPPADSDPRKAIDVSKFRIEPGPNPQIDYLRRQFTDVLETLIDDKLDLLVVIG